MTKHLCRFLTVAVACLLAVVCGADDYTPTKTFTLDYSASKTIPETFVKDGKLTWSFAKTSSVRILKPLKDWTEYNLLKLNITCNKKSKSAIWVIIYSQNSETEGIDYYIVVIPLDFTGSRTCHAYLPKLPRTRSPIGFHKIDEITFHNCWNKVREVDKDVVVTIDKLELQHVSMDEKVKGPRLRDETFFNMLDLNRPELKKVKEAWERKDVKTARAELANHIRTRKYPRWQQDWTTRASLGEPVVTLRKDKNNQGQLHGTIPLNWTGWKEVTVPLKDFVKKGKPIGFNLVSGLSLHWETPYNMPLDTYLNLAHVTLVGKDKQRRLGDFSSVIPHWSSTHRDAVCTDNGATTGKVWHPQLTGVPHCSDYPGNWTQYDAITFKIHLPPGDSKGTLRINVHSFAPDTREADEILTHIFPIGSFPCGPYNFGERIDWSCNGMDKGESRTIEWNAQLNRHFHFVHLARAYRSTGDNKYARELAQQINAWIEDNPKLLFQSGNAPYHHAWETLNTGIRMYNTWPDAIFNCLDSPEFTDDIIINIMKSYAEQAMHLMRWQSIGNWRTSEGLGNFAAGMLFPEFKAAPEWRKDGIDALYSQMTNEVYPDGIQFELALGYSNWVLQMFCQLQSFAIMNNLEHELPKDYTKGLEKMFQYLMANSMPGAYGFALNDAHRSSVKQLLMNGISFFPHRTDFLWAATNTKVGTPPVRDSWGMEWAGHYLMRSGWHDKGIVMHMDAGPLGQAHINADKLSLQLNVHGTMLLTDGGTTMYDNSRWRAYTLNTRSHNTVLVDDMDQFQSRGLYNRNWKRPWTGPRPPESTTIWHSVPGTDFCQGIFDAPWREYVDFDVRPATKDTKVLKGVSHRRAVQFIKPDWWIVLDTLNAKDDNQHTADVLYHINAKEAIIDKHSVTATTPNTPGLFLIARNGDITDLSIVKGKVDVPPQGWTADIRGKRPKGIPVTPVPTAIFSKKWTKNCNIVTLIMPFGAAVSRSAACSPIDVKGPEGSVAASILPDGAKRSYTWLYNGKPGTLITAGDVSGDGLTAFAGGDGNDFRLYIVDGTFTQVQNGEAIRLSKRGTASFTPLNEQVAIAAVNVDCKLTVNFPWKTAPQSIKIWQLDRLNQRTQAVDFTHDGNAITWDAKADAEYEISANATVSAKQIRDILIKGFLVKYPLKKLPKLADATSTITIQAEDVTRQQGGSVVVTNDKVGTDNGKAFLHWDNPGHTLEYTFDVQQAGAYFLDIKYCIGDQPAQRALLLDNFLPNGSCETLYFQPTGGWSSTANDWVWTRISGDDGKPLRFNLTKGKHTLKLVNKGQSMNMDVLRFTGAAAK